MAGTRGDVEAALARADKVIEAEFILPYGAVRTADDPARALREFVESTYGGAATLAGWDRQALERPAPKTFASSNGGVTSS